MSNAPLRFDSLREIVRLGAMAFSQQSFTLWAFRCAEAVSDCEEGAMRWLLSGARGAGCVGGIAH